MLATELGHHTLFRSLLQAGYDLEATFGFEKQTPFLHALSQRELTAAKTLAALGANIEARDLLGDTALIFSSQGREREEMVQWLVDSGANLEARNDFGKSALRCALETNSKEAITSLLNAGADKESKDGSSRSLLSHFAGSNSSQAARILLSSGADCHSEDHRGRTPLMWATKRGSDATEVMELLILHGADVNQRDGLGKPPCIGQSSHRLIPLCRTSRLS